MSAVYADRVAVWLDRFNAGETWGEIAQSEGLTRDTVRKSVQRYRRRTTKAQVVPSVVVERVAPQFEGELPELPDYESLLKLARASANIINAVDPVVTHKKIAFDTNDPIGIIFTSCAHLGSRYTFYEGFDAIFQRVLETPRLFWVSLGDDVEGFLSGFPDAAAVTDQAIANPQVQRYMLARVLDRLAESKKLLCGCASQHGGDWSQKKTGDNPIKRMYLERKVPFFDGKALVTLQVGSSTYQIAIAHEFPGHSMWNPNHAQRKAGTIDFPNADVVVMGDKHRHSYQEYTLPPHEYDAGLRASYMQHLVQVGTAKTGLDKYSIRGWSRGVLEWPILIFHPDRHEIEYTKSLDRAEAMLNE